jgi:hypothetical protein
MNEVNDVVVIVAAVLDAAAAAAADDVDNDGNDTHILQEAGGNKGTE